MLNILWPEQNGGHFEDEILTCIIFPFLMLIKVSPKDVPGRPIHNRLALVQVIAWRRKTDDPLPQSMISQFFNTYTVYIRHRWLWVKISTRYGDFIRLIGLITFRK